MNATSLKQSANEVSVMLLPQQTDNILVPDVMVVEICKDVEVKPKDDSPDWFAGTVNWRNSQVPVIAFEALNGAFHMPSEKKTVAIVNAMKGLGYLPYYAIVLNGEPKMIDASDNDVSVNDGRPRGRAESLSVSIADTTAGIPNVDWVEQHLLTYILHRN